MLVASGKVALGEVYYDATLALERTFRVYTEVRAGLVWDTRFVKVTRHAIGERPAICFLLDGWNEWHDPSLGTLHAPAAFLTTQHVMDGAGGAELTRSAGGRLFRTVQIRLLEAEPLEDGRPRTLLLSPEVHRAACAVADAARADKGLQPAIAQLLRACHDAGLIDRPLAETIVTDEPPSITRIWYAVRASQMLLAAFPAADGVFANAGISIRQVSRAIERLCETFAFEWSGWRELVHDLRLRWAVMLLSSEDIPIRDVARRAGYGSVTALGAALRKLGLPPPGEVRRSIVEQASVRKY